MGLSVFLPPGPMDGSDHVQVDLQWADYGKEEVAEDHTDKVRPGFRRVARGPYSVQVAQPPFLIKERQGRNTFSLQRSRTQQQVPA